jgi:hypothetical protein
MQFFITKEREYFPICKHEIARICRNDAAPEEITNDESATEEAKGYLTFSACMKNCIGKLFVMILQFFCFQTLKKKL